MKTIPPTAVPPTNPNTGLGAFACDHVLNDHTGSCKKCGVRLGPVPAPPQPPPPVIPHATTPPFTPIPPAPLPRTVPPTPAAPVTGRTVTPAPPAAIPPRGAIGTPRGGK